MSLTFIVVIWFLCKTSSSNQVNVLLVQVFNMSLQNKSDNKAFPNLFLVHLLGCLMITNNGILEISRRCTLFISLYMEDFHPSELHPCGLWWRTLWDSYSFLWIVALKYGVAPLSTSWQRSLVCLIWSFISRMLYRRVQYHKWKQ
jgi:hypothetical protein